MAKTRKTTKTQADALSVNMTAGVTPAVSEDSTLSELMALINSDPSEVIEPAVPDIDAGVSADPGLLQPAVEAATPDAPLPKSFADAVGAEDLAEAVGAAEAVESMIHAATAETDDGTVTGDASDAPAATTPVAADKPKKERVPRKHYTNKAERIKDRLGDALPEFTVLTLDDAAGALDEEGVKAKMDETMTLIAGMSKKKQNRAGFLLEYVSGKKSRLNNVMAIALRLLQSDGFITSGKEGNYLTALLAVPYSPAAARAMGGNTVAVLEDLKLIIPDGKGKYIANPESLLLASVQAKLAAPEPEAAAGDEPSGEETPAPEVSSEELAPA